MGHLPRVAIIGAGPTGLFAAFYAGMRSLSIKLIDPTKATSDTAIECGRCNAVRGTLADLQKLARLANDVFEF